MEGKLKRRRGGKKHHPSTAYPLGPLLACPTCAGIREAPRDSSNDLCAPFFPPDLFFPASSLSPSNGSLPLRHSFSLSRFLPVHSPFSRADADLPFGPSSRRRHENSTRTRIPSAEAERSTDPCAIRGRIATAPVRVTAGSEPKRKRVVARADRTFHGCTVICQARAASNSGRAVFRAVIGSPDPIMR